MDSGYKRYWSPWLTAGLLVLIGATVALYSGVLTADFVYDDNDQVLANKWIRSTSFIGDIFSSPVWSFTEDSTGSHYYRPVMHLTYMAVYHIFGLSAKAFHGINLLIHTLNAALLFLILREVLLSHGPTPDTDRNTGEKKVSAIAITVGALVFSLHTVNTEVVSWVASIPELTYTLFLLSSFYLFIRYGEKVPGMATSLLLFFVALLSKETAMALIFFIPLYLLLFRRGEVDWVKSYLPFILVAALYMALRTYVVGGVIEETVVKTSTLTALINIPVLLSRYLMKLILPTNLNIIYDLNLVGGIANLTFLLSAAALALLLCLLYVRREERALLLASAIIIVPLLPVLYVPAVSVGGFAERYLYLPSAGFGLIISYIILRSPQRMRTAIITLSALILILYSIATPLRVQVWQSDITLFTDTAKKSPENAAVLNNLGNAYLKEGMNREAAIEYERALAIERYHFEAIYNLALAKERSGEYEGALEGYRLFIEVAPPIYNIHKENARMSIAKIRARLGR